MQDLKDVTNDNHYENFRCEKLAAMTVGSPTNQPSTKLVDRLLSSCLRKVVFNSASSSSSELVVDHHRSCVLFRYGTHSLLWYIVSSH